MHDNKVENVLYLVQSMSKKDRIKTIALLFEKYTTDQREAITSGKIRNKQLLDQVDSGQLTVVYQYGKNTKRPHSIYYTEEIINYKCSRLFFYNPSLHNIYYNKITPEPI